MRFSRSCSCAFVFALSGPVVADVCAADGEVEVVFMVPDGRGAGSELPRYRELADDAERAPYLAWLENEAAARALRLYVLAADARGKAEAGPYHVALEPGGNQADAGFVLSTADGELEHPRLPYIRLAPNVDAFRSTFLHETGHVVLSIHAGGEGIPAEAMASIPHTTASLSDRGTAFNEGFSIHLETLSAHMDEDPELRRPYHHDSFELSESVARSEYLWRASDLANYAQTRARYLEVRENTFAFQSAFKEPDYLRVQLEMARDVAELRSANQLLQSEGFYASFFYSLTVLGSEKPSESTIEARQVKIFRALARMFDDYPSEPDSPFLVQFVETYARLYPDEAADVVDVFNDLSHGVFVDYEAEDAWRDWYLGALRLDLTTTRNPQVWRRRAGWRELVLDDPSVLYDRLGPQIACRVDAVKVNLVALRSVQPLYFDVNTVQEGIIRLIPGIEEAELERWLDERRLEPFENADDFRERARLSAHALEGMSFE